MTGKQAYREAAGAYQAGVRALFAPTAAAAGERGAPRQQGGAGLAAQAEALAQLSAETAQLGAGYAREATGRERIEMESALLAKALTDLEIGDYLLEAAAAEAPAAAGAREGERAGGSRERVERYLQLLVPGEAEADTPRQRAAAPADRGSAQAELFIQATDLLRFIGERAGESGQRTLEGLVALGLDDVARVSSVVGPGLASLFAGSGRIGRLFKLFRAFVQRAYETIFALVGTEGAGMIVEQVASWLDRFRDGEMALALVDRLYRIEDTAQALRPLVLNSSAKLARFGEARRRLETLADGFKTQTDLVNQLLPKLKYLTLIPAARLPQGKVVLAAGYMLLCGYVILVGADYVDARGLHRLNRIPGIYQVVAAELNDDGDE